LHSSPFHHLLSTIGPLWPHPLWRAGMAWLAGFHFFSSGSYFSLHFGQQACHHLFHLHSMAIRVSNPIFNLIQFIQLPHFWHQLSRFQWL
jgi:hypothetical protein